MAELSSPRPLFGAGGGGGLFGGEIERGAAAAAAAAAVCRRSGLVTEECYARMAAVAAMALEGVLYRAKVSVRSPSQRSPRTSRMRNRSRSPVSCEEKCQLGSTP